MKKIILLFLFLSLMSNPAFAFFYDSVKILPQEEINKLSDEELFDVYLEVKTEAKTSKEFHIGAVYNSAKDYNKRKNLLRFVIHLRQEMEKRQIQAPLVGEWLN